MSGGDARARVVRLMIAGDNTLKLRTGPRGRRRALESFDAALALAHAEGLDDLVLLIERRRAGLVDDAESPPAPRNG